MECLWQLQRFQHKKRNMSILNTRETRLLSIWLQDVFSSNYVTTTNILTGAVPNQLTNLVITNLNKLTH